MFEKMDLYEEQQMHGAAAAIAVQAAPYVHPKLKDFTLSGTGANSAPIQMQIAGALKGLSSRELADLEALIEKGLGNQPKTTQEPT